MSPDLAQRARRLAARRSRLLVLARRAVAPADPAPARQTEPVAPRG